jgi:ATP-dependent RNA helicase RhlE
VFTRTKHRANRLAKFLDEAGIQCDRIHGNRSQGQRESALAAFKAGKLRVLVATDIASRGIDVRELPHVINFDVPVQPEDYIHRVGRTARAENTGRAVTLVSPEEESALRAIERAVGSTLTRHQVPGFDYSVSAQEVAPQRQGTPHGRVPARAPQHGSTSSAPRRVSEQAPRHEGSRPATPRPATQHSRSFGRIRRRPAAAA